MMTRENFAVEKMGNGKKRKGHVSFGIDQETHGRLDRLKRKREKALGIRLSWADFFRLVTHDLERAAR